MTEKDTLALLGTLKVAYPQLYKDVDDAGIDNATRLWHKMFADDDAEIVTAAVEYFIATDTKGFPPSIGIIKEKITQINAPSYMSEYEAWITVKRAICGSDYMWDAEKEFEKLPPELQRIVGSARWLCEMAQVGASQLETVVGSNFMRSYKARSAHEKEYAMLSGDTKRFMAELAERIMKPMIETPMLTESEVNDRRNEISAMLETAIVKHEQIS